MANAESGDLDLRSSYCYNRWATRQPRFEEQGFQPLQKCVVKGNYDIPPNTEVTIMARVVYHRLEPPSVDESWATTLNEPVPGLRIARTLINAGGATKNRVCNISKHPVRQYSGQTISFLEKVGITTDPDIPPQQPANPLQVSLIMNQVHPSTPEPIRNQLEQLLCEYTDILSENDFDLGCTDIVQHQIDTGTERPFDHKPEHTYPPSITYSLTCRHKA